MNEYQDQGEWFELHVWDGFMWSFAADFDNRAEVEEYIERTDWLDWDDCRISKVCGIDGSKLNRLG